MPKARCCLLTAQSGSMRSLPTHQNPGLEIVLVERGCLRWQVEERIESVPAGNLFFTWPWERHGSAAEFEPGHYWHFIWLDVGNPEDAGRAPKTLPDAAEAFFSSNAKAGHLIFKRLLKSRRRSWPASNLLKKVFGEIIHEYASKKPGREIILEALAKVILIELDRIISAKPATNAGNPTSLAIIANFLGALPSHLHQPWTLESMASSCKIGRTHFANTVMRLTGDSPLEHLRRIRIEHSRTLLRTTNRSVTEIALECGFDSSQHFAKIFRRFSGISASAYRSGLV